MAMYSIPASDYLWQTNAEEVLPDSIGMESRLSTLGNATMEASREPSPDGGRETNPGVTAAEKKKRVDWKLPGMLQDDRWARSRRHSPDEGGKDATAEDVRMFLRQISSSTTELRLHGAGQLQLPTAHRGPQRPKSVLRHNPGDFTPIGDSNQSPEPLDDGVAGRADKQRSAQNAQKRAAEMAQDVDKAPQEQEPSYYGWIEDGLATGQATPLEAQPTEFDYVPRPTKYRYSGPSALRLLNKVRGYSGAEEAQRNSKSRLSPRQSMASLRDLLKGVARHERKLSVEDVSKGPSKRRKSPTPSIGSLSSLVGASAAQLGAYGTSGVGKTLSEASMLRSSSADSLAPPSRGRLGRPGLVRNSSTGVIETLSRLGGRRFKTPDEVQMKIVKHVQETTKRHRYLIKLCHALMVYGAPTHRLEEYMRASARILEIEAQFLYIPGCMIMSFDDSRTHTAEVKLVRTVQGLDLGKLRDAHDVYKEVIHDVISVADATDRLKEIAAKSDKYKVWMRVAACGLASASVGPFAFEARVIDLPIAFLIGSVLGVLQFVVAPRTELWSNAFELVAVIATTFLARAFGSINGGNTFCFSALAQSAIALILPGYLVLCSALELQSRSLIAGSVRLVYAIFYSLFLGFGLTLGAALYGAMNGNATSKTTCDNPMPKYWFFLSVPVFTFSLLIVNQAKWSQMPGMTLIACAGYLVSYFSSQYFTGNTQISSMLAAMTIGVLANLYGRHGVRVHRAYDAWKNKSKAKRIGTPLSEQSSRPPSPSALEKQEGVVDDNEGGEESTGKEALARTLVSMRVFFGRHPSQAHIQEKQPSSPTTPTIQLTPSEPTTPDTSAPHSPAKYFFPLSPSTSPPPGLASSHSKRPKDARLNYGLAAAAMLPAIFVLVPSGLSVSGSLVAGIASANQITGNTTGSSTLTAADVTTGTTTVTSVAFNVAYSVLEVAIGITVGLFLGTLLVYPMGKGGGQRGPKAGRGGLFSL